MLLVTGGAGYIGSHVVKTLLDEKAEEVIVFDNLSTGHKEAVDSRAQLIIGDLRNTERVNEVFSSFEIDAVMHFAANCYVGESVTDPMKYYQNNVGSALNLFHHMLKYKVKTIVFSSTCAVYGTPNHAVIDEKTPTKPINPYGKSKLMIEEMIKDLSMAYGMKYTTLRYFNVAGADPEGQIGEDHSPETHLIPIILQHLLGQREKIYVFGDDYDTEDGTCIRDYIHVSDLAKAHTLALHELRKNNIVNEVFNLGNEQGYSVKEIIGMCEKITNLKADVEYVNRRAGDPARLVARSKKAQQELRWKPKYQLEEIIQTAWHWHRVCPHGYQQ